MTTQLQQQQQHETVQAQQHKNQALTCAEGSCSVGRQLRPSAASQVKRHSTSGRHRTAVQQCTALATGTALTV
eukprot:15692-Heterococcus_DN1.PRE.5